MNTWVVTFRSDVGAGAQATAVPVTEVANVIDRWMRQGLLLADRTFSRQWIEFQYFGEIEMPQPDARTIATELRNLADRLEPRR